MAKLKARGRTEIFRASKETRLDQPDEIGRVWKKHTIALMSDGNFLDRHATKWTDHYSPDGVRHDSGTWKVYGKIKAELTVERALEIYAKKGYTIESATGVSSFDKSYYEALTAAAVTGAPAPLPRTSTETGHVLRTEKKAAREKAAKTKAGEKRAHEQATKHGPGFYVRNRHTTGTMKSWIANYGPYKTLEEAEEKAWLQFREYLEMKFNYLLPVQIVEASSRQMAEWGDKNAHVWWSDGKMKGPPINPNQLRFTGFNGNNA